MSTRRARHNRPTLLLTASLALAAVGALGVRADAQALRGSPASVEKMHAFAVNNGLSFYRTPEDVAAAAEAGRLVQLGGGPGWELSSGVGWAFATPEAVAFLDRLGPDYEQACQAPMVVTSATRPTVRKPRNGHVNSVHPTGIAVDIRKPYRGPCLDWLRARLLELEGTGRIEAIEERHPPHFHVAVLGRPGTAPYRPATARMASAAAVARQLGTSPHLPWGAPVHSPGPFGTGRLFQSALGPFARRLTPRLAGAMIVAQAPAGASALTVTASAGTVSTPDAKVAASRTAAAETYVVRQGDTAWDIARKHGVSVASLLSANKLGKGRALRPKMTLRIPGARSAN